MKKISIYEYYANNCPSDAFNVINKNGSYSKPQSSEELVEQLKDYVNKNGEKGLLALAKVHPDAELVKMTCSCKTKKIETKDKFSNVSGSESRNSNIPDSAKDQINLSKMMIFGGFILVGIALIMKKQ